MLAYLTITVNHAIIKAKYIVLGGNMTRRIKMDETTLALIKRTDAEKSLGNLFKTARKKHRRTDWIKDLSKATAKIVAKQNALKKSN